MRLRTISDKLEKQIHIRFYTALAVALLSLSTAIIIFIYASDGSLKEYASVILITIYLLFTFSLRCFSFSAKILSAKIRVKHMKCSPYVDISSQGILVESLKDGIINEQLLTWDRLNTISGHFIDIGFSKHKPVKYKIAFISDGRKMDMPESLRSAQSPRQIRKAINKNKEYIEEQERNFEPYSVLVEMYDEIAAEIKKYWKKQ